VSQGFSPNNFLRAFSACKAAGGLFVGRKKNLVFLFTGICILACIQVVYSKDPVDQTALYTSLGWLNLVDKCDYSSSWEKAAKYLQTAVSKERWQQSLTAFRKPLGRVIARELESAENTEVLLGAPDGEYIVVQYESSFEKKESAIETLALVRDKDLEWRVTGYTSSNVHPQKRLYGRKL
jgi:hypothetical protein